ncbi:hypothetical protein ACWZEH_33570 [Streptomyces sp. QTS137]
MRSVGVEEELLLVDPVSGAPVAVSGAALAAADCRALQSGEGGLARVVTCCAGLTTSS